MPVQLTTNFTPNINANIDSRLGPYDSVPTAVSSIDTIFRYVGMTVTITGSGSPIEYWFNPTTANGDLVIKNINTDAFLLTSSFNSYIESNTSQFSGTASFALNSTFVPTFPYTGSAIISGSLNVIGALVNGAAGNTATGLGSHAEGLGTVASGSYQYAGGQYNVSSSGQSAFIIGNGTSDSTRSNLIFASGSIVQITGSLRVNGSITGSLQGTASYVSGSVFTGTNRALSASYAISSSYAVSSSYSVSSSNAVSASYAPSNISYLEYNSTDLTVWNNGKGNKSFNTSFGDGALKSNIDGENNTAIGVNALSVNTTGSYNTATGTGALRYNSTGEQNTAHGHFTLTNNISGSYNTANGANALSNNTSGSYNTANGVSALLYNTSGSRNTAIGHGALVENTTGNSSTALGFAAGAYGSGSSNLYLGNQAGPTSLTIENNKLYIANSSGNPLIGGDFNTKTVTISGSLEVTQGITGSITSASYALTASYALNGGGGGISGTDNYVPKFNGASALENSIIYDDGTQIAIGDTSATARVDIRGIGNTSSSLSLLVRNSDGSGSLRVYDNGTISNPGSNTLLDNEAFGRNALESIDPALPGFGGTTALGPYALRRATQTRVNTAIGYGAMAYVSGSGVTGSIALGYFALAHQQSGSFNIGIGYGAMQGTASAPVTGDRNLAIGTSALRQNTTGTRNNAVGDSSLVSNTVGSFNTANGNRALQLNTSGSYNSAIGIDALYYQTSASYNTGIGAQSLMDGTLGDSNTGIGFNTGRGITIGRANTIIGAKVTGLASTLSNTIILADGDGNQKFIISSASIATLSGSLEVTQGITGSLFGTSSWATNANLLNNFNSTAFARLAVANIFSENQTIGKNGTVTASLDIAATTGGTSGINLRSSSPNSSFITSNTGLNLSTNGAFSVSSSGSLLVNYSGSLDLLSSNAERVKIDTTGKVGIGISTGFFSSVHLASANSVILNSSYSSAFTNQNGQLMLSTTDSFGIDKGGVIAFGGKYNTAGGLAYFGRISGRKENATDGNNDGFINFETSNDVGKTLTERMRITSAGKVAIGTTNATDTLTVQGTTSLNGNTTITGSVIVTGSMRGQVSALSIVSTTASMDLATNNFFTLSLVNGANTHISASNMLPGQTVNLRVSQGTAGTGTVRFHSAIKQPSGSAYTASAVANAVDVISFISFDSTALYGTSIKNLI